ncbi:MAG: hypothetical protein B6244_02290 [Candidatus Cloacimonetes bacterium 4572_55]|nr:MAG: hypothetical protein B6244_02290 [Candidatus Cloacimonetes bacterium 4572_55]
MRFHSAVFVLLCFFLLGAVSLAGAQTWYVHWGDDNMVWQDDEMFDDGTNGDEVADDNIYTIELNVATANEANQYYEFKVTDLDDSWYPTSNVRFQTIEPNTYVWITFDVNPYDDTYIPNENIVNCSHVVSPEDGTDWVVVGDFQSWDPTNGIALAHDNTEEYYSAAYTFETAGEYLFKFTADYQWDMHQFGQDGWGVDAQNITFSTTEANQEVTFILDAGWGRATYVLGTPPCSDDFEPNDTYEEAAFVEIPSESDACIDPEGEIDWFYISANSGDNLLLYTERIGESLIDPELYFYYYDEAGDSLSLLTNNDDGHGNLQPEISIVIPEDGDYYLRLAYYSNDPTRATTGAYRLYVLMDSYNLCDLAAYDANCLPVLLDTEVTVTGVVASADHLGEAGPAYFQDDGCGFGIYGNDANVGELTIGDSISVTGVVSQYNGLGQIGNVTDVTILAYVGEPTPTVATLDEIDENLEGLLVQVNSVSLVDPSGWGNGNNDIIDGAGNIANLRVDSDTGVGDMPAPTGLFNVTAVVGQFDPDVSCTGYQLLPRMTDDIEPLTVEADYLVWAPNDPVSGQAIADALIANSFTALLTTDILSLNLDDYMGMFICLGMYGDDSHYEILADSTEAAAIIDYLNAGNSVYMEGGDTWYWDSTHGGHDFNLYFGIDPTSDGSGDLETVDGVENTFTDGFTSAYTGVNSYVDHLDPIASNDNNFGIFVNPADGEGCGVAFCNGVYHTIGSAFQFGGLEADLQADLVADFLEFFDTECEEIQQDICPAQNLDVTANYPDNITISWDPPDQDCGGGELISVSESFEGDWPPTDWQVIDGPSSPGDSPAHWLQNDYNPYDGLLYASCGWGYDLNEWLISPPVDLSSGTSPYVSFWWNSSYNWHVDPNDNGDLFVQISVDNGATWESIWTFGEIGVWTDWTWYETNLDLSGYIDETVLVGFNIVANDNGEVNLDLVNIGDGDVVFHALNTGLSMAKITSDIPSDARSIRHYISQDILPNYQINIREIRSILTGYTLTRTAGGEIVTLPLDSDVTEYVDTDLDEGIQYCYNVVANYDDGDSNPTDDECENWGDVTVLCPPVNFTATADQDNAEIDLAWEEPGDCTGGWISWDTGEIGNSIGTGDEVTFSVGSRFDAQYMSLYAGNYLTTVQFVAGENTGMCSITLKVWEGGSFGDPGTEILSQPVDTFNEDDWTEVELNNAIEIQADMEYWLGYEVATSGGYPAGCDNGPIVAGYGGWIYFNNVWDELPDLNDALTYNWNMRGFVSTDAGATAPMTVIEYAPSYTSVPAVKEELVGWHSQLQADPTTELQATVFNYSSVRDIRDLTGYAIYRNEDGSEFSELVIINDPTTLLYTDDDIDTGIEYCYYATALYDEGTSIPSNTDCASIAPDTEYLVWAPTDIGSGTAIAEALVDNGSTAYLTSDLFSGLELSEYTGIFVCLGMFGDPSHFVVAPGAPEGAALQTYITSGGNVYMEGGDTWFWDPQNGGYDFNTLFGISALDDGAVSDLATVDGVDNTITDGYTSAYSGVDSYIDHIDPITQSEDNGRIFTNPTDGEGCGVAFNAFNTYHTIGVSFQFVGLAENSRATLMEDFLQFFQDGAIGIEGEIDSKPVEYSLEQNFPNPFNPWTTIQFALPKETQVKLTIYNAAGQVVRTLVNRELNADYHSIQWDGTNDADQPVSSGVYFYQLDADEEFNQTRRMMLLK